MDNIIAYLVYYVNCVQQLYTVSSI